ncbi:MAG TPA: hypothetical protein VLK84_23155, partial [Longimicrobium sp.]|nr:hypothetical protein [Longimicrobium sp.]
MRFDRNHHLLLDHGRFHGGSSQAQLDALLDNYFSTPPTTPLVVHFHGGLVNEDGGFDVADKMLPVYQEAGAYPLFFVWRAGLFDVLQNNLPSIWEEPVFQRLLTHVLRFARAKVTQEVDAGARGDQLDLPSEMQVRAEIEAADQRVPMDDVDPAALDALQLPPDDQSLHPAERDQLYEELQQDSILVPQVQALVAPGAQGDRGPAAAGAPVPTLMEPELLAEMRADMDPELGARGFVLPPAFLARVARVLAKVLWRFVRQRDHGLYATVVEEILRGVYLSAAAQRVWGEMKGDVANAFEEGPDRGGTAFVQGLAARWKPEEGRRVVLVGHSTGAVYINHLLARADALLPPGLKFEVIFLAGACGFDAFAETVHAHGDRIAHFRSFGMSDELERADYLLPDSIFQKLPALRVLKKIYPHSLLYFVSGVCEDEVDKPLVGMHRYHTGRQYA